jgi:ParB family chromosome partitioning protein
MAEKRPALGRGLESLIPGSSDPIVSTSPMEVDIDLIEPSRFQPRGRPDAANLDGLAASIRSTGLIQPIIVRQIDHGYQLIAGERRWRAAQKAGLHTVPVIVREVAAGQDQNLLVMALIENIQREDLNPIDEASAYRRLIDQFHLTQDAVAAAVGKDRATIANYLRLLRLPSEVRDDVLAGALSMGHARALVALESEQAQRNLAREIIARGLSVRETEQLVNQALTGGEPKPRASSKRQLDADTRAAVEKMRMAIGARVDIVRRGKGGTIRIPFKNEDELQRIYEILTER